MPASPITALTNRRVLNRIVDTRIKGYTALYNMLFPASVRENLFEETAQIDVLTGSTGMAPFVEIGQKAVMVGSDNGTSYTVETPFINIKRPVKYTTRMAIRLAGGNVFTNNPAQIAEIVRQAITNDVDKMNTLIDNRLEWMAAMALQGTINYSVEGQASFTISYGKPNGNTFQSATLWTTTCTPFADIYTVKKVISAYRGPSPTDAICGELAANALRALIEAGDLKLETNNGVDKGQASLVENIQENGMVYIGRIGGVNFWEYLGTYLDDTTGASTPLIRTNYIEFFSTAQAAVDSRHMFFGLIPDIKAILEGNAVTERYMEVKPPEPDQGTYEGIIKTRPLPWFYRPEWNVSLKVVADPD